MPREDALSAGKDPRLAAGLDGAGEERGRDQVPLGGVCAAAGLLQDLPRHDVSRGHREVITSPPFTPPPQARLFIVLSALREHLSIRERARKNRMFSSSDAGTGGNCMI